jgi:hypothetical protein
MTEIFDDRIADMIGLRNARAVYLQQETFVIDNIPEFQYTGPSRGSSSSCSSSSSSMVVGWMLLETCTEPSSVLSLALNNTEPSSERY